MNFTKEQFDKIAMALQKALPNPLSATVSRTMGKSTNPMKMHGVQSVSARKQHVTKGEVFKKNKDASTMVDNRLI